MPTYFWRIVIVTQVLPSRDSETREVVVRIAKTNTILKGPVNKLFALNSLSITNIKLLMRFDEKRETFPSVFRVLSILLITAASTASV